MTITKDTPVTFLTVGQLQEALGIEPGKEKETQTREEEPQKRLVYGLRGIRELFNVSHATAQKYKNTFLAGAVSQQGQIIVTDVEKALELFKNYKQERK